MKNSTKDGAAQCPQCGARVSMGSALKRHLKIHNPDAKRYKCYYDGCTFSTLERRNFTNHIFIHTGEKPYRCGFCPFVTRDMARIPRHRQRRHNYTRRTPRDQVTGITMDVVWTEVEGSSWNRVLIPEIEEYLDKVDAEYHAKHATIPQGRHRRGSAPNRSARVPENPYPACGSDSGSRKLGERAKATGHAATITQVDNHCSTTQLPNSTPWFTQRETAATQLLQSPAGFFARSPSLFCEICAANCPAPAGFLARSPPPFCEICVANCLACQTTLCSRDRNSVNDTTQYSVISGHLRPMSPCCDNTRAQVPECCAPRGYDSAALCSSCCYDDNCHAGPYFPCCAAAIMDGTPYPTI